ncbi:unnamed protein product [Victoria cruziana]
MLRFVISSRSLRSLKDIKPSCSSENGVRFASTDAKKLEGKVALITGGASGIGAATAEEFVRHGARVVLADTQVELGERTAARLGSSAAFVACDVADERQVSDAVDFAVAEHGKLNVVYNNAGVTGPTVPSRIAELDLREFDRVMAVNLRGAVAGIKHAARVMVPRGSGSVICTASISGLMGGLGPHAYTVSKFAIPGLVKSASSELGRHGVRVNCVSPFVVATPLVLRQFGAFYPGADAERLAEIIAGLGELGGGARCEERDVAKAVLYLASDDAKYVSGHNLVVDGGFTCTKSLSLPPPE